MSLTLGILSAQQSGSDTRIILDTAKIQLTSFECEIQAFDNIIQFDFAEISLTAFPATLEGLTIIEADITNLEIKSFDHTMRTVISTETSGIGITPFEATAIQLDQTLPLLTNPTATSTGLSTATGNVNTTKNTGIMYWVVSTSSSKPSKSQVKAGQTHTGISAPAHAGNAVSTSGQQTVFAISLSTDVIYYFHFMHEDASGNQSDVVTSNQFTTATYNTITDTFVRSSYAGLNGTTTSDGKSTWSVMYGNYNVVSPGQIVPQAADSYCPASLTTPLPSDNMEISMQFNPGSTNSEYAIRGRVANPAIDDNYYYGEIYNYLGTYYLAVGKAVTGIFTHLTDTAIGSTIPNGSTITLKIDGTAITLSWSGGSQVATVNDTSITTGRYCSIATYYVSGTAPVVLNFNTTTEFAVDNIPPVLTDPVAMASSSSSISVAVSTDENNGNLYAIATTSSTTPSEEDIIAGNDANGTAPSKASQTVTSVGTKNINLTGLLAETQYYVYIVHEDVAGNTSNISSPSPVTTPQVPVVLGRVVGADPDFTSLTVADYYVATAADGGSDSNNGTSVGTPFLTLQKAIDTANGQSTVSIAVRGGIYRNSASLNNKSFSNLIHIHNYGSEKPIISGGRVVSGFVQCTSADATLLGSNYANVYKATIPTSSLNANIPYLALNLCEDGVPLNISSDKRVAADDFCIYDVHNFHIADSMSSTLVTDPSVLNSYTSAQALNCYVVMRVGDNRTEIGSVTGYSSGTITFPSMSMAPDANSNRWFWCMTNVAHKLSKGKWAIAKNPSGGNLTVYVWPNDVSNLSGKIEYSVDNYNLDTGNCSNILVEGLTFSQAAGDNGPACVALGKYNNRQVQTSNITFNHNTIQNVSGYGEVYGAIHFTSTSGITVYRNTLKNIRNSSGMTILTCQNLNIANNYMYKVSASPMRTFTVVDSIVQYNTFEYGGRDGHSNKIAIYINSNRALIYANAWIDCMGYVTHQQSSNVFFGMNYIEADNRPAHGGVIAGMYAIKDQHFGGGPVSGVLPLVVWNNYMPPWTTVMGGEYKGSYYLGQDNGSAQIIYDINNISNGGGAVYNGAHRALQKNNLFTHIADYQGPLDSSDTLDTNFANTYTNVATKDYSPKANGNMYTLEGYNATSIINTLVAPHFPGFDFNKDFYGNEITTWFIGHYDAVGENAGPPTYSGSVSNLSYNLGVPISPVGFASKFSGGTPTSYSISAIPAGLSFDTSTGVLSGTPTDADDDKTGVYVTATNFAGSANTGTFNISIADTSNFQISNQTYEFGRNTLAGHASEVFSADAGTILSFGTPTGTNANDFTISLAGGNITVRPANNGLSLSSYNITVPCYDGAGQTGNLRNVSIAITCPANTYTVLANHTELNAALSAIPSTGGRTIKIRDGEFSTTAFENKKFTNEVVVKAATPRSDPFTYSVKIVATDLTGTSHKNSDNITCQHIEYTPGSTWTSSIANAVVSVDGSNGVKHFECKFTGDYYDVNDDWSASSPQTGMVVGYTSPNVATNYTLESCVSEYCGQVLSFGWNGTLTVKNNLFYDVYSGCVKLHDVAGTGNTTASATVTKNIMTRICTIPKSGGGSPTGDFLLIDHQKSGNWTGAIEFSENMAWSGDTPAYDWRGVVQSSTSSASGFGIQNLRVIGNIFNISGNDNAITIGSSAGNNLILNNSVVQYDAVGHSRTPRILVACIAGNTTVKGNICDTFSITTSGGATVDNISNVTMGAAGTTHSYSSVFVWSPLPVRECTRADLLAAISMKPFGPADIDGSGTPTIGDAGAVGSGIITWGNQYSDSGWTYNSAYESDVIPVTPTIASHPVSIIAKHGESVKFYVTAPGATSFQWKKNGVNIVGQTSAIATITADYDDNESLITCTCNNVSGSITSNPAKLLVTLPLTRNEGSDPSYNGGTTGTYFVNANVSSSGNGLSMANAFKTINEAVAAANGKNNPVILINDGIYRESINMGGRSTTGGITFKRYSTSNPIVTGQEILSGLTKCVAGDASIVGSNWPHMYKANISSSQVAATIAGSSAYNLYEGDRKLLLACDMADESLTKFFTRAAGTMHTPTSFNGSNNALTSITDTTVFAKYTSSQLLNAYGVIKGGHSSQANEAANVEFTTYNESTKTVSVTQGTYWHSSGPRYMLMNIGPAMTQGSWCYKKTPNGDGSYTVYVWPYETSSVTNNISYSAREYCFDISTYTGNLTVEGISFYGSAGTTDEKGGIFGQLTNRVRSTWMPSVVVRHCNFGRSHSRYGRGYGVFVTYANDVTIEHCNFTEHCNQYGLFINVCPNGGNIRRNHFVKTAMGGINSYGGSFSDSSRWNRNLMYSYNTFDWTSHDIHANVITCYIGNDHVGIWGNKVNPNNGGFACTWQESSNMLIGYNLFAMPRQPEYTDGRALVDQNGGNMTDPNGSVYIVNNFCMTANAGSGYSGGSLTISTSSPTTQNFYIINNILHGGGESTTNKPRTALERNNLFTKLAWWQGAQYPTTSADPSSILDFVLTNTYNNPSADDYTLKAGGTAYTSNGYNYTTVFNTFKAWFPSFDFRDAEGNPMNLTDPGLGPVARTSGDTTPPAFSSSVPSAGSSSVNVSINPSLTFTDINSMSLGTSKTFTIFNVSDNTTFETFNTNNTGTSAGQLQMVGSTVTLYKTGDFDSSKQYSLRWQTGAVRDLAGNEVVARTNNLISFTTAGSSSFAVNDQSYEFGRDTLTGAGQMVFGASVGTIQSIGAPTGTNVDDFNITLQTANVRISPKNNGLSAASYTLTVPCYDGIGETGNLRSVTVSITSPANTYTVLASNTELNAALVAIGSAGGKTIKIRDGQFSVSAFASKVFNNEVVVVAENEGQTHLVAPSRDGIDFSGAEFITLRGFECTSVAFDGGEGQSIIKLDWAENLTFDNNYIHGLARDINGDYSGETWPGNFGAFYVTSSRPVVNLTITGNLIKDVEDGIVLQYSGDVLIKHNEFNSFYGDAVSVSDSSGDPRNGSLTVEENYFTNPMADYQVDGPTTNTGPQQNIFNPTMNQSTDWPNIKFNRNILTNGSGRGYGWKGVFLTRAAGAGTSSYYSGFECKGNLILLAQGTNAIIAANVRDAVIIGNTVAHQDPSLSEITLSSKIEVNGAGTNTVKNNIAETFTTDSSVVDSNNITIGLKGDTIPYGNIFVGPFTTTDRTGVLTGFSMKPLGPADVDNSGTPTVGDCGAVGSGYVTFGNVREDIGWANNPAYESDTPPSTPHVHLNNTTYLNFSDIPASRNLTFAFKTKFTSTSETHFISAEGVNNTRMRVASGAWPQNVYVVCVDTNGSPTVLVTSSSYTANTEIAIVCSVSDGLQKIVINGVLVSSTTHAISRDLRMPKYINSVDVSGTNSAAIDIIGPVFFASNYIDAETHWNKFFDVNNDPIFTDTVNGITADTFINGDAAYWNGLTGIYGTVTDV